MNLETRIYRALLKLYPRDFRREYSEEMTRVFQESLNSQGSSFGFWARTFGDVISSALNLQVNAKRGGFMRTALVKFGAICGVAVGLNAAWTGITSPLYTTPSWIESTIWISCSVFLFLGYALLRNARLHALEIAGYAALLTSQAINILPVESLGMVGLWFSLAGTFALAFGRSLGVSKRINWRDIPLEAKVLMVLTVWFAVPFVLSQLFQPSLLSFSQNFQGIYTVYLALFQIGMGGIFVALSWAIWSVASQNPDRPTRALT
jgi:threonine/homoserine/homoserine lactone efflux protein